MVDFHPERPDQFGLAPNEADLVQAGLELQLGYVTRIPAIADLDMSDPDPVRETYALLRQAVDRVVDEASYGNPPDSMALPLLKRDSWLPNRLAGIVLTALEPGVASMAQVAEELAKDVPKPGRSLADYLARHQPEYWQPIADKVTEQLTRLQHN